jgi:precorrin 3B synthase CobZ
MLPKVYDVVVVGSGNAGFSAASAARESGASNVLLLEKSPESWVGGNTSFTAGAYRTVFHGIQDVLPIVQNVTEDMISKIDIEPYTEQDFLADINRTTNGRTDLDMAATVVKESNATIKWLAKNNIKFELSFNRQAYMIGGRFKFWGGMVLAVVDGGKGLTKQHQMNCAQRGVEVRFDSPVVRLLTSRRGDVIGVTVRGEEQSTYDVLSRGGVILCAGGFEANPSMRATYLGPGWDLAYVRGTPYNTGDCLKMAIDDIGAKPAGNWSGCHSTCWDANAPTDAGDQVLTNQFTKSGYPLGVMYNVDGSRFVDEGIDMRNFTYAKFGRAILQQRNGIAFQIWDADAATWLRSEEYADDVVKKIRAHSIEELAEKLIPQGLENPDGFVNSVKQYNAAVQKHRQENPDVVFDPSRKDGLSTRSASMGLALDKTNWALPIVKAPFLAVKVTCGITFTFGGLKVCPKTSAVISEATRRPIPGLYGAGEMAGGLFYNNYPGGSGLTAGAVFGRKAGTSAAERAGASRNLVVSSSL